MKTTLASNFLLYRLLRGIVLSLMVYGVAIVVIIVFNIKNVSNYIHLVALIVVALNIVLIKLSEKKFYNLNNLEITTNYIHLKKTNYYNLFFIDTLATTKNIVAYDIKQNIVMKIFGVYKLDVNCTSEHIYFYLDESSVSKIVEILEQDRKDDTYEY